MAAPAIRPAAVGDRRRGVRRTATARTVPHPIEITAWALVYAWGGAIAGVQAAAYFSAVTYTTTGYGDLLLPEDWRLVGAIEALTGILMCGWSTGFFFALASRMYRTEPRAPGGQ